MCPHGGNVRLDGIAIWRVLAAVDARGAEVPRPPIFTQMNCPHLVKAPSASEARAEHSSSRDAAVLATAAQHQYTNLFALPCTQVSQVVMQKLHTISCKLSLDHTSHSICVLAPTTKQSLALDVTDLGAIVHVIDLQTVVFFRQRYIDRMEEITVRLVCRRVGHTQSSFVATRVNCYVELRLLEIRGRTTLPRCNGKKQRKSA